MVVRKPVPIDSLQPAQSSSRSLPYPSSPSSPHGASDTSVPLPTQNALLGLNRQSQQDSEINTRFIESLESLQSNAAIPNKEGAWAKSPLPAILQAGTGLRSPRDLVNQLLENPKPDTKTIDESTPRSSLDSEESRDFWEEDIPRGRPGVDGEHQMVRAAEIKNESHSTPAPSTKPISTPAHSGQPLTNPFRRGYSDDQFRHHLGQLHENNTAKPANGAKGKDSGPGPYSADPPIQMAANLCLVDKPLLSQTSSYQSPTTSAKYPLGTKNVNDDEQVIYPDLSRQSAAFENAEPSTEKIIDDRREHIRGLATTSLLSARSTSEGRQLQSSLSRGEAEDHVVKQYNSANVDSSRFVTPQKELPQLPPSGDYAPAVPPFHSEPDQLSNPAVVSSTPIAPPELNLQPVPPPKPPRPNLPLKTAIEAEIAKLREQRNETYMIKHFNWFDHSSRSLRRSSMLTQNKNGPCPLLALVNALILGVEDDSRSALGTALRTREQVSLGLIIESLMDELTSEGKDGEFTELPDVDELNRFLLMLHTGMTANPRLAAPPTPSPNLMDARNSVLHLPLSLNDDRKPGTFEETQEMRLYGAFGIPLVHGWLAPRSDPARTAFARSAQTYEDAQTIQFGEEELEDKLSQVGLTPAEQQMLQDISSIKSFLESYPTQITPYGLDIINESLFPGAFAILFRNDHFSTIYKHPESGQLFTLVTDAGYSDKDEVIWESLVDVSGQSSEFFSGDFRPVGNVEEPSQSRQAERNGHQSTSSTSAGPEQGSSQGIAAPTSPQDQQQQQADADFAMALQLQEEEEARMDDARGRPAASNPLSNRNQDGNRPAIPPRNRRNPGVNRPIDPNSDEAPPPAYEEAAKGKPYLPPLGHPQHPSFDARSPGSGPSTPMYPPGPRVGQPPQRRMSAFQESSQIYSTPPLSRPNTNSSIGVGQGSGRPRDRDKDCNVM
jgi:MINDY deubiquitinase